MRTLVVGAGSIGLRHLRNLRAAGIDELALAEPDHARRTAACAAEGVRGFASLEAGLAWAPELAVIATPSHLHVRQALAAARAGCNLFVEKPLGHSGEGLDELANEVARRSLISLVGCNMRFHPGPATVKRLLDDGRIGRLLFARVHTGSYMPAWHPGSDYRQSYSAKAAMGGGCILDCIHEIDLARWYLGPVRRVFCVARQLSLGETDVEDVAMLTCEHQSGALSHVHLDYLQRSYERGCQIVGEDGSIFWDFRDGVVRLYRAAGDAWEQIAQPAGWLPNQMYQDEVAHLLACLREARPTMLPIGEARAVMRIALAAHAAARSGVMEPAEEHNVW